MSISSIDVVCSLFPHILKNNNKTTTQRRTCCSRARVKPKEKVVRLHKSSDQATNFQKFCRRLFLHVYHLFLWAISFKAESHYSLQSITVYPQYSLILKPV